MPDKVKTARLWLSMIAAIFVMASSSECYAESYPATFRGDGKSCDNAEVTFGYTNFGTDEEPEYVWCIYAMTGFSDEVEYTYYFSANSIWTFLPEHPFLKDSDFVKTKDVYALRPSLRPGKDIIHVGTYGCDIQGEFVPGFMLMTIHTPDGKPKCNFWIPYSEKTRREIYAGIKEAIETMNIKKI